MTERPVTTTTTAKPEVEAVYRFNYTTTDDDQRPLLLRKHHHEVHKTARI